VQNRTEKCPRCSEGILTPTLDDEGQVTGISCSSCGVKFQDWREVQDEVRARREKTA